MTCGALLFTAAPAFALNTHVFSSSFGAASSTPANRYPVGSPQGVAVDGLSGARYVVDPANAWLEKFDSSGNLVWIEGAGVDQPTGGNLCTVASGDTCQAGAQGSAPGQFVTPQFVAVDNSGGASDGDIYVGDPGDNLVTKLAPDGSVVSSWGDNGPNGQLTGSGATAGPFGPLAGIAVDPSGNLWVYDENSNVFEYGQDSTFVQEWNSGAGAEQAGIAVDSSDDVFLVTGGGNVSEYSSTGAGIGNVTPDQTGQITGVAVDPSTGDVYVDDGGKLIRHYDASTFASCVPANACAAADTFGSEHLSGSATQTGFDPGSGDVLVSDPKAADVDVFSAATLPDVTTGSESGPGGTGPNATATLSGTVNPDGTTITNCEFEWVAASDYDPAASDPYTQGGNAACASTPTGSSPVSVSATATGLSPGVTYDYRLIATNSGGTVDGSEQTFQIGPTIDQVAATNASSSGVTLTAQINPQGADTTYQFQYGTDTSYGTSIPATPSDIGSGSGDVSVSQTIAGLPAGTEYHWRVIATGPYGTSTSADQIFATAMGSTPAPTSAGCPNASLMTGPSAGLPDCRAYEQVTAVNKDGNNPETNGGFSEAASTGNGFTFFSESGLPGGTGSQDYPIYLATRNSTGWSTQGLLPPESIGPNATVLGWNTDESASVALAGDAGETFYLRDDSTASLTAMASLSSNTTGRSPRLDWVANGGGSEVVFETDNPLTPTAAPEGDNNIFVWEKATGTPSLVSVLPDGTAASIAPVNVGGAFNAVVNGGSGVVFTGESDAGSDSGTNQLFFREDPAAADASTVELSASQKTNGTGPGGSDPNGPQVPTFMSASPSGSDVLFTSATELTNDANTGTADQGSDLYEYDTSSGQLTDLSLPNPGITNPDPNGAEVQGTLGMSDDGSYVYFVANGVLASGASQGNCQGTYGASGNQHNPTGTCNLYMWHDGTITYITTLTAGSPAANNVFGWDIVDWENGAARVTPDGQELLFESRAPLTGYDNVPANPSSCQSYSAVVEPCNELYLYRANTGEMNCVSCDPSGAVPLGDAVEEQDDNAVGHPTLVTPFVQRNLSSSGDQVFFESPDPLLGSGSNGDIFEWEAAGAGSCPSSQGAMGCLYGLGSGALSDESTAGSDVFFETVDQLVGQDQDQLQDVYDARVDGGLASQNPPPAPAPCQGEACKPPPSSTPPSPLPTPVTVTYTGPGDSSGSSADVHVRFAHRVVHGTRFGVRITVPAGGRIRVSSRQLETVSRSVRSAGTYKIVVRLDARLHKELRDKHKLRIKLRINYVPASGPSSIATIALTMKAR